MDGFEKSFRTSFIKLMKAKAACGKEGGVAREEG
jgi:hypothetical protein